MASISLITMKRIRCAQSGFHFSTCHMWHMSDMNLCPECALSLSSISLPLSLSLWIPTWMMHICISKKLQMEQGKGVERGRGTETDLQISVSVAAFAWQASFIFHVKFVSSVFCILFTLARTCLSVCPSVSLSVCLFVCFGATLCNKQHTWRHLKLHVASTSQGCLSRPRERLPHYLNLRVSFYLSVFVAVSVTVAEAYYLLHFPHG